MTSMKNEIGAKIRKSEGLFPLHAKHLLSGRIEGNGQNQFGHGVRRWRAARPMTGWGPRKKSRRTKLRYE